MKKTVRVLIFTLINMSIPQLYSCDICGCGIRDNSMSMGNLQGISNQNISLSLNRWKLNTPYSDGTNDYNIQDFISNWSIGYNQNINAKTQWFVGLPYQVVSRKNLNNENSSETTTGIGDLNLGLNYRILDNRKIQILNQHQLLMGGLSLKLPIGKYQTRGEDKIMLPMHLQPGNGSYSIGSQLFYSLLKENFGVNIYSKLNYNLENELGYQQGKSWQNNIGIFYTIKLGKIIIIPQVGTSFEQYGTDKNFDSQVAFTGGNLGYSYGQVELVWKNLYLSLKSAHPVSIDIPMDAPNPQNRLQFSFSWILDSSKKSMNDSM